MASTPAETALSAPTPPTTAAKSNLAGNVAIASFIGVAVAVITGYFIVFFVKDKLHRDRLARSGNPELPPSATLRHFRRTWPISALHRQMERRRNQQDVELGPVMSGKLPPVEEPPPAQMFRRQWEPFMADEEAEFDLPRYEPDRELPMYWASENAEWSAGRLTLPLRVYMA